MSTHDTEGEAAQALPEGVEHVTADAVLDRVLGMTGLKRDIELSRLFEVSKSTITTWRRRNRVPYQELLRLHFAKKVDFSYCILGVQRFSHLPIDPKAGPIRVDKAFWDAFTAFRHEMRRVYGADGDDDPTAGYKRVTSLRQQE